MPVATFPLGPLQTNSYLIHNAAGQAVAVDVGGEPAPMLEYLTEHKLTLAAICLTHRHFDHLYGVAELAGVTKAVVYAPTGDDSLAEIQLTSIRELGGSLSVDGSLVYLVDGSSLAQFHAQFARQDNMFGYVITNLTLG